MSTRIELKNVRISFPKLFKPDSFNDGAPAYSAAFLFAPNSPAHRLVEDAINKAATEKWGAKAPQILKGLVAQQRVCLRNGDEKAATEGYEGMMFINARSAKRPLVVDQVGNVCTEDDSPIYPGCYVSAILDIWAQENGYGKRINAALGGVRFLSGGDPLGGTRGVSLADFSSIDEDMLS